MGDLITRPGLYVEVPVDFQYLEWHGWEAFRIIDAGIRKGVLIAYRGSRRGDYQNAELVHVENRWPRPTGSLTFLVKATESDKPGSAESAGTP